MSEKVSAGMLARMSVDLRLAINAEDRLPEAVVLVFPEPTKKGQVAVRVNEYARNERTERILDAVVEATAPAERGEGPGMVDPYHPWRPNVPSIDSGGTSPSTAHERE